MNLFDIQNLEKEIKELEERTSIPEFWNDTENTSKILSKIKKIKSKYSKYKELEKEITNLIELSELLQLEYDAEIASDVIKNKKT